MNNDLKSLKVGPKSYKVIFGEDQILSKRPGTQGYIDYTTRKIVIKESHETMMREMLLHEALHAVLDDSAFQEVFDVNDLETEKVISLLTPRLLQLIVENPRLLSFLTSQTTE